MHGLVEEAVLACDWILLEDLFKKVNGLRILLNFFEQTDQLFWCLWALQLLLLLLSFFIRVVLCSIARVTFDQGQDGLAEAKRNSTLLLQLLDVLIYYQLVLSKQIPQLLILAPQRLKLVHQAGQVLVVSNRLSGADRAHVAVGLRRVHSDTLRTSFYSCAAIRPSGKL